MVWGQTAGELILNPGILTKFIEGKFSTFKELNWPPGENYDDFVHHTLGVNKKEKKERKVQLNKLSQTSTGEQEQSRSKLTESMKEPPFKDREPINTKL